MDKGTNVHYTCMYMCTCTTYCFYPLLVLKHIPHLNLLLFTMYLLKSICPFLH